MAEQEIPETLRTQPRKVQQMLGRVLQAHPDFANVFIIDTPNTHAKILAHAKTDTLIIVLDIYDSIELKNQWKRLQAHSAVTVTIDLFYVGLVYFREGQAKEDFKIRF